MKSPVNSSVALVEGEIEPGLKAYICPESGGIWIPLQSYVNWREQHREEPTPAPHEYNLEIGDDSKRRAYICPESGRVLLRYKVGHGLNFHVDRSPVSGGVWLDKGEWEALKSKGLHTQMHLIFTASYQRQVRTAEYDQTIEDNFKNRIGAEQFEKVAAFRDWLATQPKRREIISYLLSQEEQETEKNLKEAKTSS
jgi:Zn-finger nucleic acid-binding protein